MSVYTVSVIPQNLRRQETVIQIAESLNYLSDVAEDIFKRINNRLATNNRSLNDIKARISKVNDKISSLSVAKNAIQVFSCSKYPGSENMKPYETIFPNDCQLAKTKFHVKYKDLPFKEEPLDKLQFFHLTYSNNEKSRSDGLGDIPMSIDCVNDFLLYNSGRNPYTKYVLSDTLSFSHLPRKWSISEKEEIGAAPVSISSSGVTMRMGSENYFYSPDLGDVPSIDVPIDLPNLPGIADDLRYIDESEPGIAPSVSTTPSVPNLPHIDHAEVPTTVDVPHHVQVEVEDEVHASLPEVIPKAEPPPTVTETITKKPEPIMEEVPEITAEVDAKPLVEETKQPMFEVNNLHANLMDAIRKAGGAKNAKLRSTETKSGSTKKTSGGDLMAEFHAKLSLRRKGISGNKRGQEGNPMSAMERISEQLIPPPAPSEHSESDTTNEEWD